MHSAQLWTVRRHLRRIALVNCVECGRGASHNFRVRASGAPALTARLCDRPPLKLPLSRDGWRSRRAPESAPTASDRVRCWHRNYVKHLGTNRPCIAWWCGTSTSRTAHNWELCIMAGHRHSPRQSERPQTSAGSTGRRNTVHRYRQGFEAYGVPATWLSDDPRLYKHECGGPGNSASCD